VGSTAEARSVRGRTLLVSISICYREKLI